MKSRLFIIGACLGLGLSIPCAAASTQTIVSLTFDDGLSDAPTASQIMGEFGFKGTFFIITGELGTSGYMTVNQVKALQTAGHEIAGHTITHPDLTTLTPAQAQNEVCGGRTQLINLGFNPVDFAYPFGASNSTVEAIVSTCYGSGRGGWELDCTYTGCSNAESIPPVDAYWIRTPDAIVDSTTVSQIEQVVTSAENSGGGWVPLQFHHVCDNDCDLYSITPADLTTFLTWLQARAGQGTVVKTVAQVMSGIAINPFPGFTSMTPLSKPAGSSSVVLTAKGTGFITSSVVQWNGTALATTRVSSTTLTATVPANDLTAPGPVSVTVFTPGPGGGTSTAQSFSVTNNPSLYTIWAGSAPPVGDSYHDPSSIEVGVRFHSDVSGVITGLRFYKWSFNTGSHIGHLWTDSGTLLISTPYANETASGWQSVIFSTPVIITASATYVASYFSSNGYATSSNYFTTSGVDRPPLHAPQSVAGELNGVYTYGASPAFPTQNTNNSNFWVDVLFTTNTSKGVTPNPVPTLISLSPSSTTVGSGAFTLTATGAGFISSSTVQWNGTSRATTFVSSTTLRAAILASDIVSSGTANITVSSPGPGGGISNVQPFAVNPSSSTPGATFSLWSNTTVPGDGYKDPSPLEVGVKFRTDVNGFVTALRFYKGSFNTGAHSGHLWSSTGTLLAQATYTGETASGWQQVTLSTPVAIAANTTYVASYFTTTGYSVNSSYFTTAVNTPPLHGLQNGTDGANGVYLYSGASAFPNQSTNSSNYWADLVFATTASTGTSPSNPVPTLTAISPSSATAGSPAFTLTLNGSNFINGSVVQWNGASRATTIISSTSLAAAITAADIGSAGTATVTVFNPVPGGGTSGGLSFTINASTAGTSGPWTLWSSTATPGDGYKDPSPLEVGMRFRSDTSGYITGIRFYKGTFNTGTHSGHLWTNTGTLLGSVTFSSETASGWQTAYFATPVAITANTTYITSYFTTTGYSVNVSYFTTAINNAPLHGLQDGQDGTNGIYLYSAASAFPTQGTKSSNYWVDVVFNTTPTHPANAPAFPPSLGAGGDGSVIADFSQIREYPNPWRSDRGYSMHVTFDQLPPNSTVKIFTVSAHWIKTLDAPAGSVRWDLTNDSGESVASGFYIYLITNNQNGRTRGTLAVIR